MASSPYFDSAGQQIDTSKKALLEAVATGGTAGKQAYDAAQAQAAQARQEAVARAAERSALYGVGGNDQTFLSAYDARANQGAVNRSNFESGLAQTQASGESYLEKARASIPVLQGININKAADEETKIKLAIQAAKDKAAAELEKEQRSLARTLDAESRAEARAIARENRSVERAAKKEAAKPPSLDELLGGAAQAQKTPGLIVDPAVSPNVAGPARPGQQYARNLPDQGLTDLAYQLGLASGVDQKTLAGLYAPGKQAAVRNALTPAQAKVQKDQAANALATKYDTKGVTYATAQSVLGNVDFKRDVQAILDGWGGKTRAEVERDLYNYYVKDRGWTAEYHVLVGEYLPLLPEEE